MQPERHHHPRESRPVGQPGLDRGVRELASHIDEVEHGIEQEWRWEHFGHDPERPWSWTNRDRRHPDDITLEDTQ